MACVEMIDPELHDKIFLPELYRGDNSGTFKGAII